MEDFYNQHDKGLGGADKLINEVIRGEYTCPLDVWMGVTEQ